MFDEGAEGLSSRSLLLQETKHCTKSSTPLINVMPSALINNRDKETRKPNGSVSKKGVHI